MILECNHCGAPLDITGTATKVKCGYCGKVSDVSRAKKVSEQTPPGWAPPQTWTPPDWSKVPHVPLEFHPAKVVAGAVRAIMSVVFLAVLGIGLYVAFQVHSTVSDVTRAVSDPVGALGGSDQINQAMNQMANAIASASQAASRAAGAAGAGGPVVCSGNESLSLQGQTISIADGTAVTALGNCTLRLTAATIVGRPALVIQDNAHVIIEGGTFTTSGGTALRAQGNATVEVTSATITGNITVQTSGNAQVRLQQSTIIGDRTAIQATSNSKVDARGSSVQGRVSGRVVQ